MPLPNVIFPILLVNYFPKRTRIFIDSLVQTLIQLVFHILLPVLIFWEISRSPFRKSFSGWLIAATFNPTGIFFALLLLSFPLAVLPDTMSSQLGGDPELSSSVVRLLTLMARIPITVWVWMIGI